MTFARKKESENILHRVAVKKKFFSCFRRFRMNLNLVWLACVPLYTSRQSANQNGHPRHHPVSGMVVCHAKPKTWLWLPLLSLSFSVAATIPFCLDVDFLFFRTDLKGLLWGSIEFVDYFVCVLLLFCIYIYFHQLPGQVLFFSFYFFFIFALFSFGLQHLCNTIWFLWWYLFLLL